MLGKRIKYYLTKVKCFLKLGGEELSVVIELFFSSQTSSHTFARLSILHAPFFAGLVVDSVLFDLFNDSFLLYFSLEASQGAFDRFAFVNNNERQKKSPPRR